MTDQFLRSLDDIKEEQEAHLEREMDPDMALLSDYLAGELPADKESEVRARIQNDPDFRDLASPLLLAAEHGARPSPMPRADLDRKWLELRRRIGLPELSEKPRTADGGLASYRTLMAKDRRRQWRVGVLTAAAMVFFLAVSLLYFEFRPPQPSATTPWGRSEVVALPDGSRITVSMGSRLVPRKERPGNTSGTPAREYTLLGEAAFYVSAGGPFYVFTESALITVTGTRFTIHAYGGEPTQVTVDEGTVLVQPRDAEGNPFGEQLKLTPGMRARIVQGFPAERIP